MKVDMSPKAIENRLKLVGELTKACLLIRWKTLEKTGNEPRNEESGKDLSNFDEQKMPPKLFQ